MTISKKSGTGEVQGNLTVSLSNGGVATYGLQVDLVGRFVLMAELTAGNGAVATCGVVATSKEVEVRESPTPKAVEFDPATWTPDEAKGGEVFVGPTVNVREKGPCERAPSAASLCPPVLPHEARVSHTTDHTTDHAAAPLVTLSPSTSPPDSSSFLRCVRTALVVQEGT